LRDSGCKLLQTLSIETNFRLFTAKNAKNVSANYLAQRKPTAARRSNFGVLKRQVVRM
jgi:hypothetical protein